MTHRLLDAFRHLVRKNLLLLGILGAIWLSMHHPVPESILGAFDVNAPLVALIFAIQGLHMSFKGFGRIRDYAAMIGVAALVSVVCYPLLAAGLSALFGLEADFHIGFILLASLPTSLEAAMAMAASAGGDPLTAVILLVSLNLIGIATIPANIALWVGGAAHVSEMAVLQNLLFYLFIPAIAGQLLRRAFPTLPARTERMTRHVPMVCIVILVYTSCSSESALFHSLRLSDLAHIIIPCVLLHVIMVGAAHVASRKWLRMEIPASRSFLFITAEKPMSLSVALWSMTYAAHHPLAIFPILVFYVCQVVFDSALVAGMLRNDLTKAEAATQRNTATD
ncbi:MAG: bile acid:sodium symporter [Proteobacteria bacterium]|nr:bile acid:sodium symporter [Pseudomonadota bacterium]